MFSPDGKWVAYQSNESGHNEIYVTPFPGPGGTRPVFTAGGTSGRGTAAVRSDSLFLCTAIGGIAILRQILVSPRLGFRWQLEAVRFFYVLPLGALSAGD